MEALGTPAAAIMTDKFIEPARVMAEVRGLSGYPFAVVPHPIASNDSDELRAKAADAVRQSVEILTSR